MEAGLWIIRDEKIRRDYLVDIGSNSEKEIDFMVIDMSNTYYIQFSFG